MKTADHVVVRFKGGPLGGEEQVHQRHTLFPRLRVPSYVTTSAFWSEADTKGPTLMPIQVEEYQIRPTATRNVYEGQWIHPQERLILENERLKKRIKELEDLEILLTAIKRLVG